MKIRTVTLGVPESSALEQLPQWHELLKRLVDGLHSTGYEVQTSRLFFRRWRNAFRGISVQGGYAPQSLQRFAIYLSDMSAMEG